MNKPVFYTNPQSRGRIVHWMLEEIGLPYETVWLEYGTTMKSSEYLAVNPMGKVPALTHEGAIVTETAAICAYLADRFPEKNLIPPLNHADRATYFRWLFFAAGPLELAVTAKTLSWQVPEGKNAFVGFGSYSETIDTLEKALTPGPYICGGQFTAADVYLGAQLGWGLMFGTIEKRPLFEAYVERINARPAALQANRINEDYLKSRKS
ncbi:putative glutathione transferase [Candidatus Propionivibrio aalborgensis]|jgi:glutathione S-transferase|uniref:Putative glutathione transferase n=1 Tax=Candidatus Propionivibrio aalborgensis TaxID=1860101 RepID=A0A1A8XQI6_9RHOO|nr:glutathione S-transferase family protein [Candidatus Propionivibrio aalborgensis]MBK7326704.1 glutathione S-transferase family protein [Propionivibrio sp.]MBK7565410.1 glutathione S-transferase family protein [Propionivibrio sp.]MBK9027630.1 glutathione S-transferase family protein [Propionivibrio sp.]MBP6421834.1 glutathione S-transferase family protein [Propionivibrio sp.]SBT06712.1 putative glutathione transferase [Candidatus Propionivibrio aalborgensis]